jgi:predicted transcriptional regulator
MNDRSGVRSKGALEDIAYLTRSVNRVAVLDSLAADSYTPSELTEVTGASRPTLGRILHEFEDRGWTERTDDGYVATTTGQHVVCELEPFAGAMAAIRTLGEAVAWLPTDELTIGLQHFRDATVRRPERHDPMDVVDVFTERLREATEFRALTHLVAPEPKQEAMLDGVTSGRLETEFVLTDDLVGYLRDVPKRDDWFHEVVASGARAYRYDDSIPCNLFLIDELVALGQSHPETSQPYAFIETDDETVWAWARDLFDAYRAEAERIDDGLAAEEASVEDLSDGVTPGELSDEEPTAEGSPTRIDRVP